MSKKKYKLFRQAEKICKKLGAKNGFVYVRQETK